MKGTRAMQSIVDLPDSLYEKSKALAASRGTTLEQLILEAVEKEVEGDPGSPSAGISGDREVALPIIRSSRPGTLDLCSYDFDDLLA